MKRVVIVGGGVGGTLVANLIARKLQQHIRGGQVTVTVVDERGQHVYQPGFMYIAMGSEVAENLVRPEWTLLDSEVRLEVGRVQRINEADQLVELEDGSRLHYDQLVLAPGARILPRGDRALRGRGASLLRAGCGAAAAVTRSTRSPAGGSSSASRRCRTSARPRRWRWPS